MPSVQSSGTYTLTAAEVTVGTLAANYVAVVRADLSAMASGDVIRLRLKSRVLTGGADVVVWDETFTGVQADPMKQSIPISSPFNLIFTAIQTSAPSSLKTMPWDIAAIA